MRHFNFYLFNLWAVLVAALIQWVLGALWYSLLFRKPWMAVVGHKPDKKPKDAAVAMISSFIGGLILSFVLAHVVYWASARNWHRGAVIGFICWLGFIAAPLFAQHLYEKRPCKLFAINAGYWLLALVISGVVLAVWR
ncbi:MAG: DUF1761 domain-containing protein [Terracidiphilus sp.]|jgi:hypothetical protein